MEVRSEVLSRLVGSRTIVSESTGDTNSPAPSEDADRARGSTSSPHSPTGNRSSKSSPKTICIFPFVRTYANYRAKVRKKIGIYKQKTNLFAKRDCCTV